MKGYIEIEVLIHTEQSEQLAELGVPTDLESLETENRVFFRIDAISRADDYTIIDLGDTGYMTKEPFDLLFARIKNAFGL